MKFVKGQSGNPGGRPAILREVRALTRQHTGEAIAGLLTIARDAESEMVRLHAWIAILDRAWGRPTQPIAGDDDMDPLRVGRTHVLERIESKLARLAAGPSIDPEPARAEGR